MRIEPDISGVRVVLLGDFNPAIFTPAWFALHGILPKSAAGTADVQVVHNQLSSFTTEWLELEVTPDRFLAATQMAPNIRVRDFVVHVFEEHLFDIPVRAIGINRHVHFRAASAAAREQVGRTLAPASSWGKIAEMLELGGDQNGMVSLTVRQAQPGGRPTGGQVSVTVEPSVRIDEGPLRIYVHVNDHYEIDSAVPDGRAQLFGFLEDDFELSIRRADDIVDYVMSLATDR